jgi:hypothetical protein
MVEKLRYIPIKYKENALWQERKVQKTRNPESGQRLETDLVTAVPLSRDITP